MSDAPPSLLLALVDDLFVRGRIDAAAEATGVEVRYVRSTEDVREAARTSPPRALLVGMAATRRPWADLIRDVKADGALGSIYVLAFGPHKNLDLRTQALEAGADRVVANSAFVRVLPTLLTTPSAPVPDDEES
jgi:DNA-binding response OmpR family regulator